MAQVILELGENGEGTFYISENGGKVAVMNIGISDKKLTVYHTDVIKQDEGKGLAKELLNAMVDYARQNNFKVIPLCPFVHVQFKRSPKEYEDIWQK